MAKFTLLNDGCYDTLRGFEFPFEVEGETTKHSSLISVECSTLFPDGVPKAAPNKGYYVFVLEEEITECL